MESTTASQFRREGFAVVRAFLSSDEIERIHCQMEQYVRDVVPTLPREEVFFEDKSDQSTLKQLSRINQRDGYFQELFTGPRLTGLARDLLGADVTPHAMQWLNKPGGAASAPTPPHQDGYYFRIRPNEAITFWLALDPVDEGNGCVRYLPGSHRGGVRPHERSQTLGFSQAIVDYGDAERSREVAVTAQPGDLIAHHSLTVHRAGPNRSNRPRRALTAVYFSVEAKPDAEALAQYQEQLKKELIANERI